MRLKRALIIFPLVVLLVLLQSYFWVPTYESQTTGNPARITKFIEASIGDAKILNPALNADSASSQIAGLVFEGLLDLDENLNLRGRLARQWMVTEEAFLVVDRTGDFPDGTRVSVDSLLERLRSAGRSGSLPGLVEVTLSAPEVRSLELSRPDDTGNPAPMPVSVELAERVKLTLSRVNQALIDRLRPILGHHYGSAQARRSMLRVVSAPTSDLSEAEVDALLPVLEHNPIIDFELRDDVYFHDGHRFDAGDVRFTYEAIMEPRNLSPRTSDFEPIKSVVVLAPHTVRVVYKRLFSPAVNAWTMGILPEHLLNDERMAEEMQQRRLSPEGRAAFGMRDSRFNRAPIGTGAFKFVKWESDEVIHLTRDDRYWEGPALFRDYYYRIIPDSLTQEVEFRTGAIDRYSPQPHQIARFRDDDSFQSFSSLGFSYNYIGYNNRRTLFRDPRVRRALGMTVNVQDIIDFIMYGEAKRISGPYPKNTEWYDQNLAPLDYDPEGALALLESAGWRRNADGWLEKDGRVFEFNLITNNGNLVRKAIMTTVQNSWRKLGIKCNTQLFEWAVFLEDFINPGDFDAVVLGWSMGADPDLFQIWHSSQASFGQLNFVGYANDNADDLIVKIRREYDVETQRALTHQLHQQIAKDQPYTFLFAPLSTQVLDRKVVMVEHDGAVVPLRAAKSGSLFFYFNRWKRLEHAPQF